MNCNFCRWYQDKVCTLGKDNCISHEKNMELKNIQNIYQDEKKIIVETSIRMIEAIKTMYETNRIEYKAMNYIYNLIERDLKHGNRI